MIKITLFFISLFSLVFASEDSYKIKYFKYRIKSFHSENGKIVTYYDKTSFDNWNDDNYDDSDWQNVFMPNKIILNNEIKNKYKFINYQIRLSFLDTLDEIEDPAIYLGKFGDIDKVYINGKFIGGLGILDDPNNSFSFYHVPRVYRIPKSYLKKSNVVGISGTKKSILDLGIYERSPEIGNYNELKSKSDYSYFITTGIGVILAFFSIFMGFYHLYLFYKIPKKIHNFYYFIFSLFSSLFIFSLGWGFNHFIKDTIIIMKIHAFLGVLTGSSYFFFINKYLSIKYKILNVVYYGLNIIFLILFIFIDGYHNIFKVYNFWYPIGLFTILYVTKHTYLNKQTKVLFVSSCIMFVCAIYDSLYGLGFLSSIQLSGIGFFCLNVGIMFSLAYEFSTAYVNVEKTVHERTKDLSVALDELRSMERLKETLFTNISHDLKTPIAVAMSNIEQAKSVATASMSEYLNGAFQSMSKLKNMVINVLDSLKAQSTQLSVDWNLDKPVVLVKQWMKQYEVLAKQKSITLNLESNMDETVQIPWDRFKMERVFDNLISNAFKYVPTHKCIFVRLKQNESHFIMEIEDQGPGIDPKERKKIFERYYQGESTVLKDHGGSGIGLSFVNEAIKAMNGFVIVKDGDQSHSKFVIELPLFQNVPISHVDTEHEHPTTSISLTPYPKSVPHEVNPKKMNLLIVEDNPDIAQALKHVLEDDYNVYFAQHGKEGLTLLETVDISCILSDVMMPVMDGKQFLQNVRKEHKWQGVPFLFLTSMGQDEQIVLLLNQGAQDYLTKPFNNEVLKARIKTQVNTFKMAKTSMQAEKMAALGLLTAGIGHEIKNPLLGAINSSGFLMRLGEKVKQWTEQNDNQAMVDYLKQKKDDVIKSAQILKSRMDQIHTIVDGLSAYSSHSKDRVEMNVYEMIAQAYSLLNYKMKEKNININITGQKDIKILGYVSLYQVLINLIDNAIYACPKEGGQIDLIFKATDQERVSIIVKDNGEGIEKNQIESIFVAFHTTKPPGKGTGLGLYICKTIIEQQHGGLLKVESQKGHGATFVIDLPTQAPVHQSNETLVFHGT